MMELDVEVNFTSSYMVEEMFFKKTIACALIENKSTNYLQEKENSFHKVLMASRFVSLINNNLDTWTTIVATHEIHARFNEIQTL